MEMKCDICESEWTPVWTDTHGVAQCWHCGTPYQIYHYEGEPRRRVNKPPELLILPEWVPTYRRYWVEFKRRITGGFSCPGGQEVANSDDIRHFNEWIKNQPEPTAAKTESA